MGATQAGLALNPYVITFMAVSSLAGARIGASGRFKPYLLVGSAIVALGFALLSRLDAGTPTRCSPWSSACWAPASGC
jgi:hypothetical protein